ncbi:hypothetical protein V6N12_003800 [Hibiscus sabdariffa]|uniref:Reverse transcriptase zinc-binding domain-containing protein n=1 Tax=Hibiscus sabdariffa TaxID=183260 RepID=A0ABR2CLS7_9ROSI
MFLWLVLRQRLMTNVERVRRGLSSDPSCSSCGCYSETILHILRDCPLVRFFWKSIIPQVEHEYFFGASLDHWVAMNIKTSRALGPSTPPFVMFLPFFSLAKLWSILVGLQLAFSIGFSRVQVQSDSSVAIRLILDPMAPNSFSSLVRRISSLQNLHWLIFDDIPELIRPLLAWDHEGPPYRRRC